MATIGIVKTENGDWLMPTYRVTREENAELREVDFITAEMLRSIQSLYASTQMKLKELYDAPETAAQLEVLYKTGDTNDA